MDVTELHRRTIESWLKTLEGVGEDQWANPTPCTDWDVRALVNHVVGEDLWTPPLMEGQTIADVGDRFDGDVLGDDPIGRGREAADQAAASSQQHVPKGENVHLSFGDFPSSEYAYQLAADHLIHGWDLAKATNQDATLDPDLVEAIATWFAPMEDMVRSAGVIADRQDLDGDPQTDLLSRYGRRADWSSAG